MTVVPVLITSCQVSLKPNSGPVATHASTTPSASAKHNGRPVKREAAFAVRVNQPSLRMETPSRRCRAAVRAMHEGRVAPAGQIPPYQS